MNSSSKTGEKVYGHVVTIEVRTVSYPYVERKTFRKAGSEAACRRTAGLKRCFLRVVEMEPYTEEQWVRCFGRGRM